jgi:hypothetical protein
MSEIKPTTIPSFEHVNAANCDCPACDANKKYEIEYDLYLQRKQYITFEMKPPAQGRPTATGQTATIENWLNENQSRGYEMVAAHNGLVFMRAMPPNPPTARDVIAEALRRQKEAGEGPDDGIGKPIGGMQ